MEFFNTVKTASIEPAILLHMIAFKTFYMTLQNIFVHKACRINLNYPSEVCTNLSHRYETEHLKNADAEPEVQKFLTDIIRWKSVADSLFPLIFVLFLGAWSDRFGKNARKLCICLPVFGYILQTLGLILLLIDESASAISVAIVSSIPAALTGSIPLFNMAIFSYISDITPVESQTVRSGITNISYLGGMAIGNLISGFLSNPVHGFGLDFKKILTVSGILDTMAFVWFLIVIRDDESKIEMEQTTDDTEEITMTSRSNPAVATRRSSSIAVNTFPIVSNERSIASGTGINLREIFTLKNFFDSCKVIFKARENNTRLKLFLLLFPIYFLVTFPEYGEESVNYLYLRYRLNWNLQDYGLFSTYRLLIGFCGNLIAVAVLSSVLKLSDPVIGFFCCLSQITACIIYSLAPTTLFMFLGAIIGMGSCTVSQITKAIIMKIIPSGEIGKVFAFMGCLDAFFPLMANPFYATVYKISFVNILPGLYFLVSAMIGLIPFAAFAWFICHSQKSEEIDEDGHENESHDATQLEERKSATNPEKESAQQQ